MSNFKKKGTVYAIYPVQDFPSGFFKREIVLEINTTGRDGMWYKDFLKFEAIKDRSACLNDVKKGDDVEVEFSIGGRRWTPPDSEDEKIIMYLRLWDLKILKKHNEDVFYQPETVPVDDLNFSDGMTDDSDLPF